MSSRVFWAVIDRVWSKTTAASWQRPSGAPGGRPGLIGNVCICWEAEVFERWLESRVGKAATRSGLGA